MTAATCECGHEKRDHRFVSARVTAVAGACKVCLCDAYAKLKPPVVADPEPAPKIPFTTSIFSR